MISNSFGRFFGITTFGESHGPALGVVIEDIKPGIDFPLQEIQSLLDKRKPRDSKFSSQRKEKDRIHILSGVFEGKTTGMPICLVVYNEDADSSAYQVIRDVFRPGHADYTYFKKFKIYDYRGGGRSSGRETIARVAASGLVNELLKDIQIQSRVIQLGKMKASKQIEYKENPLYWSDWNTLETVNEYLDNIKESGNSVGAIVEMTIDNLPSGLGDPVFEKLDANVAKAIISIGGVKGIEFGDGFILGSLTGEESNDPINSTGFSSNHMGGILGGISTGQKLILRYVTKPTPSIRRKQKTVNSSNEEVEFQLDGRFDTCIAPRVIPVAEAMTKLVLADAIAYQRLLEGEPTELSHLREAIDKVDEDILIAIYRRFEIVKQIRALKIEEIIPLEDPVRESQLMERLILIGKEWGIGEKKIQSIWKEIIQSGKSP